MAIIKYLDRVVRMNSLISMKSTGKPEEFASRIGIKRSTLFLTLQEMREIGTDIRYSNSCQSYYYADERRITIKVIRAYSGDQVLKGLPLRPF